MFSFCYVLKENSCFKSFLYSNCEHIDWMYELSCTISISYILSIIYSCPSFMWKTKQKNFFFFKSWKSKIEKNLEVVVVLQFLCPRDFPLFFISPYFSSRPPMGCQNYDSRLGPIGTTRECACKSACVCVRVCVDMRHCHAKARWWIEKKRQGHFRPTFFRKRRKQESEKKDIHEIFLIN